MEDLDYLREKVKEFRKQKGLPYSFLAREIGIKKQSFYNFMGGAKGLSQEKKEELEKTIRRFM